MKVLRVLIPGIVCFLLASDLLAQTEWSWQNPLPTGSTLHAVQVLNSSTVVCVGDRGSFVRSTDSGLSWFLLEYLGGTSNSLRGVSFVDDVGMAVGENGTILRTEDGGDSWTIIVSPTTEWLYDILVLDENAATVVGGAGTILQTTDGGVKWIARTSGTTNSLNGIFFADANTGTTVGVGGIVLHTTDGGNTWMQQISGTTNTLNDVCFTDANTGTIVGGGGTILRTSNGGSTWISQNSRTTETLTGVSFTDESNGLAVGLPRYPLRTTNGGTTWTQLIALPQTYLEPSLIDVDLNSSGVGVCVGSSGFIFQTTNSGAEWVELSNGHVSTSLYGIHFWNPRLGIAVGHEGASLTPNLFLTTNGGTSWAPRHVPGNLGSVWFADSAHATVVAQGGTFGFMWRTTDQGQTWQMVSWPGATLYSVRYVDPMMGMAVGALGTIIRTLDAGATWQQLVSGTLVTLTGIHMINRDVSVAVGGNTLMRTTDGGTNWQAIPSPVEGTLLGVAFVGSSVGVAVGGDGTVIRTTDGGLTWTPQVSNTLGDLWDVRFNGDGSIGYAVFTYSVSGLILHTTDTGITWTVEAVPRAIAAVSATGDSGWTIAGSESTILHMSESVMSPLSPVTVDIEIDSLHKLIPAEGDTFAYSMTFENHTSITQTFDWWTVILRPRGNPIDPHAGPEQLSLDPFETVGIDTVVLQVPFDSRTGEYSLIAFVGTFESDTVDLDTTYFTKLPAIPCGGITQFKTKCRPGGTIQARITLLDTSYAGDRVEFTIDDVPHETTVNQNRRAILSLTGYSPGVHTVELTEPPGCYDPVTVTCPAGLARDGDDFWDEEKSWEVPTTTTLLGNYPNPFNPSTTFRYTLSEPVQVTLKVYNMLGQLVKTVVNDYRTEGYYEAIWDGRNESGTSVSSDIYIYRMTAGAFTDTKRMLLLK